MCTSKAFRDAVDYVTRGAECRLRVLLAGGTTRIDVGAGSLVAPKQMDARFKTVDQDSGTYWLGRVGQSIRVRFRDRPCTSWVYTYRPGAEASLARPQRVVLEYEGHTLAADTMPDTYRSPTSWRLAERSTSSTSSSRLLGPARSQVAIAELEFEVPQALNRAGRLGVIDLELGERTSIPLTGGDGGRPIPERLPGFDQGPPESIVEAVDAKSLGADGGTFAPVLTVGQ